MGRGGRSRSKKLHYAAGTILEHRYVIQEVLGEGGFATVYRGRQLNIDRPVAIKILSLTGDDEIQRLVEEKFLLEAKSAARIGHPHVVSIFDYGLTDDTRQPFIVMELLHGYNLEEELTRRGPMAPARAIRLMMPCLEALAEAHRLGIIHRDLKPANLFLSNPGTEREQLKVLDYGVARVRAMHVQSTTARGQLLGTPRYLSPEYIQQRIVTPTLDVYQIGLVLVELMTGRPVVTSRDRFECLQLHTQGALPVPEDLIRGPLGKVLRKALALDHLIRYQEAGALKRALALIDLDSIKAPGTRIVRLDRVDEGHFTMGIGFEEDEVTIPQGRDTEVDPLDSQQPTPRFPKPISAAITQRIGVDLTTRRLDPSSLRESLKEDLKTTEWSQRSLTQAGLRQKTPESTGLLGTPKFFGESEGEEPSGDVEVPPPALIRVNPDQDEQAPPQPTVVVFLVALLVVVVCVTTYVLLSYDPLVTGQWSSPSAVEEADAQSADVPAQEEAP